MQPTGGTYSSVHLRERDKVLEERHQKELATIERKLDRLKWNNTDLLKQLFEAHNRANRLASSLGFKDIYEAQVTIDNADQDTSYRECTLKVESLERELSDEKNENERIRHELRRIEEERVGLRIQLESSNKANEEAKDISTIYKALAPSAEALSVELSQLQQRYDSLVDIKERAAARYKADYKKWREFKKWLFDDEAHKGDVVRDKRVHGTGKDAQRKQAVARLIKREKLKELGPNPMNLEGEDQDFPAEVVQFSEQPVDKGCDKENQRTPVPEKKKRTSDGALLSSAVGQTAVSTLVASATLGPGSSLVAASDKDRPSKLILPFVKQEELSSPLVDKAQTLKRRHPRAALVTGSSDTEEDTQAFDQFPAPFPLSLFKIPPPRKSGGSSETEDDSQMPTSPGLTPAPARVTPASAHVLKPPAHPLPARPAFPQFQSSNRRHSDTGVTAIPASHNVDAPRPRKVRRLSGDDIASHTTTPGPAERPLDTHDEDTPIRNLTIRVRGTENQGQTSTPREKEKGKGVEMPGNVFTPANPNPNKALADYSAFKGRGRYGQKGTNTEPHKTINALYAINPQRNGGLDFQYDEVVRRKEDRRKMDAGDCECCRDYYEAVGPLPKRLQQPLWRSPPVSPVKPCSRHPLQPHQPGSSSASKNHSGRDSDLDHQKSVNSHKQAISRHRHHWARASTPPGYWNIGFPTTQEADDINEQAREMHKKKREEVENEAERGGGKYRKR